MSPRVLYEANKIQILEILQYLCTCSENIPFLHRHLFVDIIAPFALNTYEILTAGRVVRAVGTGQVATACASIHHRRRRSWTLWKLKLSLWRVFSLKCDFTHCRRWILLDARTEAALTNQGSALCPREELNMVFNHTLLSVKCLLSLRNGARTGYRFISFKKYISLREGLLKWTQWQK